MGIAKVLATDGCDRATAYHMSNKIVRFGGELFVTWLDGAYRPVLGRLCPDSGELRDAFPLAQGVDNHCGAALALGMDGRLHAMCGSHGMGGFIHRWSATPAERGSWSLPGSVGIAATYPSLVCRPDGTLVLSHRHTGARWGVNLHYQKPGTAWNWPLGLVQAAAPLYTFTTNHLCVGDDGTIHLLVEFYKTYPDNRAPARSCAYTCLHSLPEHDHRWFHDDGREAHCLPIGIEDCVHIEHDAEGSLRPGPLQLLTDGRLCCTRLNQRTHSAAVMVRDAPGEWRRLDLDPLIGKLGKGWMATSQGSTTLATDGSPIVVTTVGPAAAWESPHQQICVFWLDSAASRVTHFYLVPKDDPQRAAWLPAVEQDRRHPDGRAPFCIYTDGNRGESCVNDAVCKVHLLELSDDLRRPVRH